MAFVNLRFQVNGEVQVSRAFEASGDAAKDMRDPLSKVGKSIFDTIGEQFRTEGAYGETPWTPLNPRYAAWKEQQVGPNPILVFTGQMRRTLLDRASLTVTPRRLVYSPKGPHAEIASYHQGGAPERGLPQRKPVQIPSIVARSWERFFSEWLRTDVLWRFGR
ncbi:MAG: phage virion morphogenesis protein [Solirubrobacterales bacterium]